MPESKTPKPIPERKPIWFMLSYDATEEAYKKADFRKKIILALRTRKVVTMSEPVATTILFLDPDITSSIPNCCIAWENIFKSLLVNFKFIVTAVWTYTNDKLIKVEDADDKLNEDFQLMLQQVLKEEVEKNQKK